jgi:hypothetical protein
MNLGNWSGDEATPIFFCAASMSLKAMASAVRFGRWRRPLSPVGEFESSAGLIESQERTAILLAFTWSLSMKPRRQPQRQRSRRSKSHWLGLRQPGEHVRGPVHPAAGRWISPAAFRAPSAIGKFGAHIEPRTLSRAQTEPTLRAFTAPLPSGVASTRMHCFSRSSRACR